jgi:ankyrin repeat protein
LAAAARSNDVVLIEALLESGDVRIDAPDSRGYSPLMLAAYCGHLEAVELLLAWGANPNGTDNAGNSILMGAAFKGHAAMVECLLAHGADPTFKNAAGLDARGFALQYGRTNVVPLLTPAAGANGGEQHG